MLKRLSMLLSVLSVTSIWWLDTLKRIEKIIPESAFDNKKKKPGLKSNPRLALTGVQTTGPRRTQVKKVNKAIHFSMQSNLP